MNTHTHRCAELRRVNAMLQTRLAQGAVAGSLGSGEAYLVGHAAQL